MSGFPPPPQIDPLAFEQYPRYFSPKPPVTTNRFTISDEITGGRVNGISVQDLVNKYIEDFYRNVDADLEERLVEYLRKKGYTVIEPKEEGA